jgi:hypothetical protein
VGVVFLSKQMTILRSTSLSKAASSNFPSKIKVAKDLQNADPANGDQLPSLGMESTALVIDGTCLMELLRERSLFLVEEALDP